jgi:shikimate kinase
MTELHITCGIQGSGKTTLAKKLSLNDNTTLYIYDTFAAEGWNSALRCSL